MADSTFKLTINVVATTASASAALKSLGIQASKLGSDRGGIFGGLLKTAGAGLGGLSKLISGAGTGFSALSTVAGVAFGAITGGIGFAATAIKTVLGGALSMARYAFYGLGVAGATVAGAIYAAFKLLQPASFVEDSLISMQVLLGSVTKAKQRMAELQAYDLKAPFELPQIIEAANLMQAFGIYSKRNFAAAGDAAATFKKPIEEVVRSLNYLAGGRTGEAFESLARIGITRQKLNPLGLQFAKSGELIGDPMKAFDTVIRYMEMKFGGMAVHMSTTMTGVMSNIRGSAFKALAGFGEGALQFVIPALLRVQGAIDSIGAKLKKFNWRGIGTMVEAGVGTAATVLTDLLDPEKRGKWTGAAKAFTVEAGPLLMQLPQAIAADLGTAFGRIMNNFGTMLALSWEALYGVLQLSWQTLGTLLTSAWEALSLQLQDSIAGGAKRDAYAQFRKENIANAALQINRDMPNAPYAMQKELMDARLMDAFEQKRYGIKTKAPTGMEDLFAAMGEIGVPKTINALRGMGKIGAEAFTFDQTRATAGKLAGAFTGTIGGQVTATYNAEVKKSQDRQAAAGFAARMAEMQRLDAAGWWTKTQTSNAGQVRKYRLPREGGAAAKARTAFEWLQTHPLGTEGERAAPGLSPIDTSPSIPGRIGPAIPATGGPDTGEMLSKTKDATEKTADNTSSMAAQIAGMRIAIDKMTTTMNAFIGAPA